MREDEINDRELADTAPETDLQVIDPAACPECQGSGALASGETCPVCEGTGRASHRTGGG